MMSNRFDKYYRQIPPSANDFICLKCVNNEIGNKDMPQKESINSVLSNRRIEMSIMSPSNLFE